MDIAATLVFSGRRGGYARRSPTDADGRRGRWSLLISMRQARRPSRIYLNRLFIYIGKYVHIVHATAWAGSGCRVCGGFYRIALRVNHSATTSLVKIGCMLATASYRTGASSLTIAPDSSSIMESNRLDSYGGMRNTSSETDSEVQYARK
ncbi:hypothetical protein BD410DRAFT_158825 [Rickenella mellea]|uniref:Uncharacterized protein n=1 Tax=Rickenella mellea TaxID=50990 RepID=A0A4Y7Q961_9AGAM|nr:hypothetical protein BD410DRAFT_158825 [Rickenella mellea]